jgi:sulfate transport system ATP-binding protein
MSIVLENLTKRFAKLVVVDRVSLEVEEGELFVLLGASGSGKSTILRLVAGLTAPDEGKVLLHGKDVTALPPQRRGIGFVFQNYSVFRHMTVAQNIEFALRIRKKPKIDRARRREELLDLVDLSGLGSRSAAELSGGQQQRVALARALAHEPAVLLLDEPFGALDVKIRAQLRRSLREIQDRLGVTTVLVTHDQEEAFELADRIGVVERGRLLEVGSTERLYRRPRSLFVATFLGVGTVLVGRAHEGKARFGPLALPIPPEAPHEEEAPAQVLFRPEEVLLTVEPPPDGDPFLGKGAIVDQAFTGPLRRLRLKLPSLPGTRQIAPQVPFGEEGMLVDAVVPVGEELPPGELCVSLKSWQILKQPAPRILVCDGGTGSTAPLVAARSLMEKLHAAVTVLGVAEDPDGAQELRDALERRGKAAGLDGVELRVRMGKRFDQVFLEQREKVYELLLLAASDALDARPNRLGKTARALLERAPLPMLVLRAVPKALERVLICTAAGEPGKSDVRLGGRLARQLSGSVTLLHVVRGTGSPHPFAQAHLERAAATLRGLEVPTRVCVRRAARPADGILSEAEEGDHHVIVVGSHLPARNSPFRLDDITQRVITGTSRPVLVVPADRQG